MPCSSIIKQINAYSIHFQFWPSPNARCWSIYKCWCYLRFFVHYELFINSKVRKSNFQLFSLPSIRKSSIFFDRKTLVTSLVLSIIDYCNILLSGLLAYKIRPLEIIICSAVRVVYNIPHCEKQMIFVSHNSWTNEMVVS